MTPRAAAAGGRTFVLSCLSVVVAVALSFTGPVSALTLEEIDPEREWRVRSIAIGGETAVSAGELRAAIATQARAWFAFWRPRPIFDPIAFGTDLQRLQRFYEARGYYHARVTYDLVPRRDAGVVDIHLTIDADAPVVIASVTVTADGYDAGLDETPLEDLVPVRPGEPFSETAYQRGEEDLLAHFLDRGYAWATVTRAARVDLAGNTASISYDVPVDALKFSAGPGIAVDTPVGPLLLFVGFPIDPPRSERSWQLTFSVGQFF